MKFKAFAFDLDGTLVDTKIDFAAIYQELNLPDGTPLLEEIEQWSASEKQRAQNVMHHYEQKGAEESLVIADAFDFLVHLENFKIPFAVFTRNSRATALKTLEKHKLNIPLVISRDDANPKPHPEGLHMIAKQLAVKAHELLFVGDYIFDLQAGQAAGVSTALYLPQPPDFETLGAYFTFDHYDKLRTHCFN